VIGSLLDASALQPGRTARNHLLWLACSQGLPVSRVDEVIEQAGLAAAARRSGPSTMRRDYGSRRVGILGAGRANLQGRLSSADLVDLPVAERILRQPRPAT
jgi:hypothetical protein